MPPSVKPASVDSVSVLAGAVCSPDGADSEDWTSFEDAVSVRSVRGAVVVVAQVEVDVTGTGGNCVTMGAVVCAGGQQVVVAGG